jgi:hypothetical protein
MPDHGEHVAALFEAALSLDPGEPVCLSRPRLWDNRSLRQEVEELSESMVHRLPAPPTGGVGIRPTFVKAALMGSY